MLTSVVIPCFDGADDTRACLQALSASVGVGPLEIVIVDNGSRDPAALAAAAAHPCARLVTLPENLGFAGGCNRGLEAARGDILVVLNNDTLPAPTMLSRLRRALAAEPAPALVAPVSNFVRGEACLPVGNLGRSEEGRRTIERMLEERCGGMLQDADNLAGLCLMFHRDLWRAVGPFDERFGFGNHEDDDLCLRVRLRGGRLVVARDAFLHHWGSRTFRAMGVDYDAQLARTGALMRAKWQDEPAWQAVQAVSAGDLEGAGCLAAAALAQSPAWPDGQLILARAAHARGDHGSAVELATAFLRACPASWPGHKTRTVALIGTGRLRDAIAAARAAITICPVENEHAAALLTQVAHGLLAKSELASARETLLAALELSENGERFCLLGRLCATLGDRPAADRAFAGAAAAGHEDGLLLRGINLWHHGDHAAALRTLGAAVANAPEDARAHEFLAQALAACAGVGTDTSAAERALSEARSRARSEAPSDAERGSAGTRAVRTAELREPSRASTDAEVAASHRRG
ncbi:MAG: glycosyltransferase family 2 protein [Planctomycetota bacterium]